MRLSVCHKPKKLYTKSNKHLVKWSVPAVTTYSTNAGLMNVRLPECHCQQGLSAKFKAELKLRTKVELTKIFELFTHKRVYHKVP